VIAGRRSAACEALIPTRSIRARTAASVHDHRSRVVPENSIEAIAIAEVTRIPKTQVRPVPASASSLGK
jgi:hypothetical protein